LFAIGAQSCTYGECSRFEGSNRLTTGNCKRVWAFGTKTLDDLLYILRTLTCCESADKTCPDVPCTQKMYRLHADDPVTSTETPTCSVLQICQHFNKLCYYTRILLMSHIQNAISVVFTTHKTHIRRLKCKVRVSRQKNDNICANCWLVLQ